MKYIKAAVAATVTTALLSACSADPPAAPEVPTTSPASSQGFLDQWEKAITSPTPQHQPSSWQDLLVPPVLDPKDHHQP